MTRTRHLCSLLLLLYTCSALENIELRAKKDVPKNGQKRLDIHASRWKDAQNAINSLIDESISNEVAKAKMEVKALLEKNIAKHLHEASKHVTNTEVEPSVAEQVHYDVSGSKVCQDQFDNCGALAASGVCDTSREAMKKHCARTCELCDEVDEDLPPASPTHKPGSHDTWTIIGANGEKFTTSIKDIEKGTRKASISSAQVERLLEYVKHNAPHLKLKKVKPGVLKLIRVPENKEPAPHKTETKKHQDKPKKDEPKKDEPKKDEQKKDEPKKGEPKKDEPKKDEPKKDEPKKDEHKEDLHHDNYWTIKEDKPIEEEQAPKTEPKAKGPMIHFDLSSIKEIRIKDKEDLMEKGHEIEYEPSHSNTVAVHHEVKSKSEEYLKHICHPMCKKTCISSCAPGCCAGEHHKDFPLYHRKSTHCHPFCKKHCISSCPLTCCAGTETIFKSWKHPHVHHINPSCHPMCKKDCVPSCPKACCTPKAPKRKSHCHPLCKKSCLSSCPLSCCSKKDRQKEKCHPLCRKTCLPACPDECCRKKKKQHKLVMKSNKHESKAKAVAKVRQKTTCPGLCPDSCAPACHSGCCDSKKVVVSPSQPLVHEVPSGCTANCVYECIPGCPPACCGKKDHETPEVSRYTYPQPESDTSTEVSPPVMFPFPQPIVAPYMEPPPPAAPVYPQEQMQAMYSAVDQSAIKNAQAPSTTSQTVSTSAVSQSHADSTNLFAPKHCPSSCLTHCSPECVRSDCCDLD